MTEITNNILVLTSSFFVLFMFFGSTMAEIGLCRSKNSGSIAFRNITSIAVVTLCFWVAGFGMQYGAGNHFWGGFSPGLTGDYTQIIPEGVSVSFFFFYQLLCCCIVALLASSVMAGRAKFFVPFLVSAFVSLLIYPIAAYWGSSGWLYALGFLDGGGTGTIYLVSGSCAFVIAKILGSRAGKYDENKKEIHVIPQSSISFASLGIFALVIGGFALNMRTVFFSTNESSFALLGIVFKNTLLCVASATLTGAFLSRIRYEKADITLTFNAALSGFVAISSGSTQMGSLSCLIIGFISGAVCIFSIEWMDRKLKIDDPVGIISVFGICGMLNLLFNGLFSLEKGFFLSHGIEFFGIQILGCVSILLWSAGICSVILLIAKKLLHGIRVDEKEELEGLDLSLFGLQGNQNLLGLERLPFKPIKKDISQNSPPDIMPIKTPGRENAKITRVDILMRQTHFEILKEEMNKIGVTGMTVTNVVGCGMQKGREEYYRGVNTDIQLLPKIQVSIIIAKVPVDLVINTARKVLYSGYIGDGKIFVYTVDNVVKVRTGEQGYDAMQGVDE